MSELINTRGARTLIRKQLLATASAMALAAYIASTDFVRAEDAGRPTVWVELGGQMELLQGTSSPFTAPFMLLSPTPGPYKEDSLIDTQRPPGHAFGLEGKITFEPENSDWIFSASLRYGRSNTRRHVHHQSPAAQMQYTASVFGSVHHGTKYFYDAAFAETKLSSEESHAVLDFQAGREVGIGTLGRSGTSNINAGVRFAQFSTKSTVAIYARPAIDTHLAPFHFYGLSIPLPVHTFYDYTMLAHAERSFRGIGPTLSWNASASLLGSGDSTELSFDWGVNAAVLFGRQKAKTNHSTQAYHLTAPQFLSEHYVQPYPPRAYQSARSHAVVVPNLGGFAGLSVKYPNAKISLGYRADFFFGAVDTGIDQRHTKDLGFSGPFATISIGLGG